MIEQDTIKLLRECDAGVKMGIASIDDVLDYVKSQKLKDFLIDCKNEHVTLDREIGEQLNRFHDEGKNPNPIAKTMSSDLYILFFSFLTRYIFISIKSRRIRRRNGESYACL